MRRILSLALCMLFAALSCVSVHANPTPGGVPWSRAQVTALARSMHRMLRSPVLRGAHVGLVAIDTVRGKVLYSLNADQEFMPASNFKLLTGSAALDRLGTNFSFLTTVASDAPIDGETIDGNLYLRGGGDAHLNASNLDEAAAALAARGLKTIHGALITDATHFDAVRFPGGWSWDDLPYYYAPAVSALELEDGVVHVFMSPGPSVGSPVTLRIEPQTGALSILNDVTTGPPRSPDTSDIARVWNSPQTLELTGTYPLGMKSSDDLAPSVPDPRSYAGDVFARALAAHGITVAGGVRDGAMPGRVSILWWHASGVMPKLLAEFWYPSDNLMGELFLKELGVVRAGEPGTDANGRLVEAQYLRSVGVDPSTVTIEDGSGLSQYDRITPRDLLKILQADWSGPYRAIVLDALPVAGVRGTLKAAYVGTPAQGKVYAKTGSMSHVRTISGFVQTKTHGPVTFSFLIDDWMGEAQPRGAADLAKLRGAIFSTLATQ